MGRGRSEKPEKADPMDTLQWCKFQNGFSDIEDLESINSSCSTFVIHPNDRRYNLWASFLLVWRVYSAFITPLEFGFFRGSPEKMAVVDYITIFIFLVDMLLQFFVSYGDPHTHRMV